MSTSKQAPVGNYRLSVKNFGPIAQADVDLRQLTVFVGPSNTGKSYLATLIYAIHLVLEHGSRFRSRRLFGRRISSRGIKVDAEARRALTGWLKDVESVKAVSEVQAPYELPPLKRIINRELKATTEWGEFFGEEMKRCFGVSDLDQLVRKAGTGAAVNLTSGEDSVRFDLKISNGNVDFSLDVPGSFSFIRPGQREKLTARLRGAGKPFGDGDGDYYLHDLLTELVESSVFSLVEPIVKEESCAFYLPADRTGVMHGHQALVGALIQSATMAGLRPPPDVQMLSGVLGDFLQRLINMGEASSSSRGKRRKSDLADLMEQEILGGEIKLFRSPAGYPTFRYKPRGWKDNDLPLTRASSMVSELAPVVLYLRYLVRPGDVLIIEEPEAHLHPELQAAFARLIVRLARSGVRVIMTTHSEWLLEQLTNLVLLSRLPENQRRGDYATYEDLPEDQFGAWLFEPKHRPKGSVVEELKIDPADGLLVDYEDLLYRLHNEWVRIGNRIEASKPQ